MMKMRTASRQGLYARSEQLLLRPLSAQKEIERSIGRNRRHEEVVGAVISASQPDSACIAHALSLSFSSHARDACIRSIIGR